MFLCMCGYRICVCVCAHACISLHWNCQPTGKNDFPSLSRAANWEPLSVFPLLHGAFLWGKGKYAGFLQVKEKMYRHKRSTHGWWLHHNTESDMMVPLVEQKCIIANVKLSSGVQQAVGKEITFRCKISQNASHSAPVGDFHFLLQHYDLLEPEQRSRFPIYILFNISPLKVPSSPLH